MLCNRGARRLPGFRRAEWRCAYDCEFVNGPSARLSKPSRDPEVNEMQPPDAWIPQATARLDVHVGDALRMEEVHAC
eukprot:3890090-Alexandrium_andersonii.AAC.1